jgi:hypothetical protein
MYATGVAAMVAAAAWVTLGSPAVTIPTSLRTLFWADAVLLAAAGIWLTATARGLALRIRIEGRPASQVLARLQVLGSQRPSAFLDLPPLRDHAAALRKLGVTSPDLLRLEEPEELAAKVKVTTSLVRRWQSLAALALLTSGADGARPSTALLAVLLASEVDSVEALRAARTPATRNAFRKRLRAVIAEQAADCTAEDIERLVVPATARPRLTHAR